MFATTKDTFSSIGLLVLRVGIGGFMMTHGWGKLLMLARGEFDQFGDPIGIGKTMSLICAVGAEFGCALLIVLGLLTRLAALPLIFTMGVAAFIVHAHDPLLMNPAGASKEPALLFMIPFVALAFTGAGKFSLDAMFFGRNKLRGGAGAPVN